MDGPKGEDTDIARAFKAIADAVNDAYEKAASEGKIPSIDDMAKLIREKRLDFYQQGINVGPSDYIAEAKNHELSYGVAMTALMSALANAEYYAVILQEKYRGSAELKRINNLPDYLRKITKAIKTSRERPDDPEQYAGKIMIDWRKNSRKTCNVFIKAAKLGLEYKSKYVTGAPVLYTLTITPKPGADGAENFKVRIQFQTGEAEAEQALEKDVSLRTIQRWWGSARKNAK